MAGTLRHEVRRDARAPRRFPTTDYDYLLTAPRPEPQHLAMNPDFFRAIPQIFPLSARRN
jgi:hypothetical protein